MNSGKIIVFVGFHPTYGFPLGEGLYFQVTNNKKNGAF